MDPTGAVHAVKANTFKDVCVKMAEIMSCNVDDFRGKLNGAPRMVCLNDCACRLDIVCHLCGSSSWLFLCACCEMLCLIVGAAIAALDAAISAEHHVELCFQAAACS